MNWTVAVDIRTCLGSGICAGSRPDVFRIGADHAEVTSPSVAPDEDLIAVADTCPARAITIRDESGSVIGPSD